MRIKKISHLHAAAYLFSRNPTMPVLELATELGMAPRSLYRWTKTREWREALTQFGYPADAPTIPPKSSKPKRSVEKDTPAFYNEKGYDRYANYRQIYNTHDRAVTLVAKHFKKDPRVVRRWAEAWNWQEQWESDNPGWQERLEKHKAEREEQLKTRGYSYYENGRNNDKSHYRVVSEMARVFEKPRTVVSRMASAWQKKWESANKDR